jgi:putative ubiquitin-RnfH superfamily antitoxin RatB of RatAB toxin-antitoxin module
MGDPIHDNHPLTIEVVYLSPTKQTLIPLNISENTSLLEGIRLSGILKEFPEIDFNRNKVGIFGKIVPLDTQLKHGDRVEIYRPLLLDPKEKRFLAIKGRGPRSIPVVPEDANLSA